MATKKKKTSKILDQVREELEAEDLDPRDLDEDIDPLADRQRLGGLGLGDFGRRPRHPDEVAIDEMLMGLEGNDWYLKLSKETAPNVWQFKRRINEFRNWADLEYQINLLVQKETAAEIKRRGKVVSWGSGRYQITFFSDNGLRGNKKKPVFFDIDAQETDALPPTSQTNEMLDILRETVQAPREVIEQNVQSMQKGMELAAMAAGGNKSGDNNLFALMMNSSNNQTQMMMTMMTAVIGALSGRNGENKDPLELVRGMAGTMKDMGMLPAPGTQQPQSLTDQLVTFKTLGLIKDPNDSDPVATITKMQGVFRMLQDLTGAGPAERPGIMEKIVDTVGPHIGKLISAVENISAVKARESAAAPLAAQAQRPIIIQAPPSRQIQQQRPGYPVPMMQPNGGNNLGFNTSAWDDPGNNMPIPDMPDLPPEAYAQAAAERIGEEIYNPSQHEESLMPAPVMPTPTATAIDTSQLTQELYNSIMRRDYSSFPRITQMLDSFFGPGVIRQQILAGQMDAKGLVNYVTMFDRNSYTTKESYLALQDYAHKYIESIRQKAAPSEVGNHVSAKCDTCSAIHDFDNKQQWDDEMGETSGHVTCGINGCQGMLSLGI
jgi:hypothetical protein